MKAGTRAGLHRFFKTSAYHLLVMSQETPSIFVPVHPVAPPSNDAFEELLHLYDCERVVVDLSGMDVVEPSLFSELSKMCSYRQSKCLAVLRLVIDSSYVRNALRAVGLEQQWPIFRTLEDAVASFEGPHRSATG